MSTPHVADAEASFKVVNVAPDFCTVNGQVVPFDIYQELSPERSDYSPDVEARGGRVLTRGSVVDGVVGNMGEGVMSGVSQGKGTTVILEGDDTILVNGKGVARHGHRCMMNIPG